ncbi:MAG TPA: hypothetical protein VN327_17365 [Pseudonocardiaceae bacterium]|nr:hypothetical protein [Pseudonocardiaceae bacterium]
MSTPRGGPLLINNPAIASGLHGYFFLANFFLANAAKDELIAELVRQLSAQTVAWRTNR